MKKKLLSFMMIGAMGVFTSTAQITITDSDIISIGDNVEQANDTIPGAITIGSGGASQTWNFSTVSQDVLDTLKFRTPSTYPGNSSYPSSNMGMESTEEGNDSTWIYLTKNTSGLFVDGIYQIQNGQGNAIPLTNTIITFPSTMGTTFGGTWNGTLVVMPIGVDPDGPGPLPTIDSVKVTRASTLNSNIDGWGNVTTPLGTFPSLRQIVSEENIDTTWTSSGGTGTWTIIDPTTAALFGIDPVAYDTTRTARWWSDDVNTKFPVVEMDYEANGTVNDVTWLKTSPYVGVSEAINETVSISLNPNPAKNEITLTSDLNNAIIQFFDITGKFINAEQIHANQQTINISYLKNGIYFYNIKTPEGKIYTNKFVVAK